MSDELQIPGEVLALETGVAAPPIIGAQILRLAETAPEKSATERAISDQRNALGLQ